MAKKLLIADVMLPHVDDLFGNAAHLHFFSGWAAALGYTLQLYFDFSGYSDMAVGIAYLLGYHFPQNFDSPYKAANPSQFWRRWHMTLSFWMRDYLFIPLGGSRRGMVADGTQPDDHLHPRRHLARRRVDVHRLGPAARPLPVGARGGAQEGHDAEERVAEPRS